MIVFKGQRRNGVPLVTWSSGDSHGTVGIVDWMDSHGQRDLASVMLKEVFGDENAWDPLVDLFMVEVIGAFAKDSFRITGARIRAWGQSKLRQTKEVSYGRQ